MRLGYQKPLTMEDLWYVDRLISTLWHTIDFYNRNLKSDDQSANVSTQFQQNWQKELAKQKYNKHTNELRKKDTSIDFYFV